LVNVRLVNVSKRFGSRTALQDVSFEVRDKEFFVLAGPPGAGKTTTLRVLAGLEQPDTGEIYIGDQRVNDIEAKDRDVAMVFENLALYPNKTGYDNIAFPLRKRGLPEPEIRTQVTEVARMLLIEHLMDRYPATYSGGEMQRLALARAIVRRPRVYLLDQPLAQLDALIRANMRAELKKLVRELGQTIIFTTHDQIEALSMGDRVGVINGGRVLQLDTPDVLYNHPKDAFVATFVGQPSMNLIDCRYQMQNGRAMLIHEEFSLDVTGLKEAIERNAKNSDLRLGIRPEDIAIDMSKHGAVVGQVYVREPLGARALLSARVGSTLLRTLVPAELTFEIGQKVWFHFPTEKIHLFDRKTGAAVV
jgi:multiple sugar transport system ATP-binding protein